MNTDVPRPALKGKKALVVGIANEHSIAYGCAKAFREVGAELAVTFLNDKARPHVEPLAKELEAAFFLPLDVLSGQQKNRRIKKFGGLAVFHPLRKRMKDP